ncbi:separin isoform X2 [Thrips palmi]|uniref:separase n=1 Tax=Thrips palmi TaxID=161013 RepID=A0A6P9AKH2_THRPL|nr:separin isoform X2 [Thrips palmi]
MDQTITLDVRDKCQELREILSCLGCEPSGPFYKTTHKHLAQLLFKSSDELEAIFHLSESHGATLRNKMVDHLKRRLREQKTDAATIQSMLERVQFEGSFIGFSGLQQRLAELPKEWTAVQVTLEWDPLSRFPCRNENVNRGLGMYVTRFAFGSLSEKVNDEKPFTTFLPPLDDGEDRLTFMAAIRNCLSKFEQRSDDRRRIHEECSLGIEAIVNEMQMWLGGWLCLFMGRLVSEKLELAVKTAIDSFVSSYKMKDTGDQDMTEKARNILYLLASCPSLSSSEVKTVVSSLFKDQKFASYMSQNVCNVMSNFSTALHRAERHPVILLVDEELDILPFEVISPLQDQSFTRMPSIHLLHALYYCHKESVIKKGINTKNCFYVINPAKNLPNLEKLFETMSTWPVAQNWKGVYNTAPTSEQFLSGLQDNDLFVYCGHGGGNQYLTKSVDTARNKAVVFLFGCSSSSLNHLGGRVEMTSLSYNYLISGSPCVVGMLWQVLDVDINSMTKELLRSWCSGGRSYDSTDGSDRDFKSLDSNRIKSGQKVPYNLDSLENDFKNVNINSTQSGKSSPDLCKAVCLSRKLALRFLNKAALVIRGLPVNAM